MIQSFAIRIEIDTPIALRNLLHLDGLLGAEQTLRGRRLEDIPLERRLGSWQGSVGILETGPFGPVSSRNVRLKHVPADGVPPGIFDHLKPGQRRLNQMHPMRNVLTPYTCLDGIRAVWFTARGDIARTLDLLSNTRNLGAMGRTGWGRIVDITTSDIRNEAMTGLVFPGSGLPARTVPVATWNQLGLKQPESAIVSMQRANPPYWIGEEVPCISPIQVDAMGTATEIKTMINGPH
jgi:hypothetical protein